MDQQGQGDVVAPAVMDNSCPFCGGDPYHRTDLGEPVAVTCCETACALWDSRDEDTVEIDRADLIAISNRLRESRILETENDRLRTLLSSSRGEPQDDATLEKRSVEYADRLVSEGVDPKDHGLIASLFFEALTSSGSVPTSLAQGQLHWVACERCGGSGEVEVRPSVGPYDDPTTCAEICSACDGTGRFCEETHPAERDDDLAVPTSLAGQGPDGYVIVPKEPTEEMLVLGESNMDMVQPESCGPNTGASRREELRFAWYKMLSAAPRPTAGGDAPTDREMVHFLRAVVRNALQWHEDHRVEVQKIGPGTIPQWVCDGWAVFAAAPQPTAGGDADAK